MSNKPQLLIFAGPNGSGKTTAAEFLLKLPHYDVHEFVNADEIARGLSPFNPEGQKVSAGRLVVKRIKELIKSHQSFAFETTLAGSSQINHIESAKAAGYSINMYYFFTHNVEINLQRIQRRVKQDGHDVPEEDVKRRYRRSIYNLRNVYWDLCDKIVIYNTMYDGNLADIAIKKAKKIYVSNEELWNKLNKISEAEE